MLRPRTAPGKQHCQEGTPEFIGECVKTQSLRAKRKLLDPVGQVRRGGKLAHFGQAFIIKRNLRRECPEQWLATARRVGELKATREGKNVYTGFVDHLCPGGAKSSMSPVSVAFEVIERLTDADGNRLLIPTIEVNTYWRTWHVLRARCVHFTMIMEPANSSTVN